MQRRPRGPPFNSSNGNSYHKNPPQPTERPRPGRPGIIDQRLIQGAQNARSLDQFRRDDVKRYSPGPESHTQADDEMELDAFDLELLSQPDQPVRNRPGLSAVGNGGRHPAYYQPGSRSENPPMQNSRFFNSNSHVTPLRGLASSSSGAELRTPSSPLAKMTYGKLNSGPKPLQLEGPSSYSNHGALLSGPHIQRKPFENIPLSIRGIVLVPVNDLQDRFRSLFDFPLFNAIQSKCFRPVYNGDDNIVLSAPTGSGKTVIMELTICRLLITLKDECFKVIYQAPTKSLCSERFRDWNRKFSQLGLQCAELTGDTDYSHMRSIQNSQIIITTPEKWDSMTRKWKDHARLMQLVKLFLIDEVHILKETRGATLEAVVSRMKSFGSNVRFVALSATVPNSEDIATWLGKDATNQHVPAHREHFGEEFRPVKLQKFVYGYQSSGNDFAFDKMCTSKLSDVMATHSCRKPTMIFCSTRNSTVATAKELSRLWSMTNPPARLWKCPTKHMDVHNVDLRTTIATGVAFHHAGLDPADRHTIESGFLQGQINIICCTSTLAVGVNLPCHMVIIKNTVGWQEGGCKEYSDLELMQMLGRAGRPQFDDSAIAIILTRKERVNHYEKLVSGSESLESCLHLNLIDHLNAEIGLGNVTDVESAVRWLAGTFLFVRLRRNPTHYKLKEGADRDDEDEMLRQICEKDIKLLQECNLISKENLKSTQFGDAMARYYVRFETMKALLTLRRQASISQILSAVAEAEEFRDVRLKAGEKSLYKEVNRASGIRFPIKVDIAMPAHKISLLIQSELGAVDFPDGDQFQKHKFAFQQDKTFVFSHVNRLIRCVIDCQISIADSFSTRNALELARSFGAKVWDDSPLQMKQIEQIGIVAVRKLAGSGITSIDELEQTEAHQIDMVLSKNPPFGVKLLGRLKDFPKLRVSVKMTGKDIKPGQPVKVRFRVEIAFMNDKVPAFFQRQPVYVCFLAETSNGHMIDFRRMNAGKVRNGHEILLCVELKDPAQYIACYAMCDDIAGTMRYAELKPELPIFSFLPRSRDKTTDSIERPRMNTSLPRSNDISHDKNRSRYQTDIFDGDDLDFEDFLAADQGTDWPILEDRVSGPSQDISHAAPVAEGQTHETHCEQVVEIEEPAPIQLENGRWACNHRCKDKTVCKHFCCRDGLDKPPKPSRSRCVSGNKKASLNQLTLSASITKRDAGDVSDNHDKEGVRQLTQPVLKRQESMGSKRAGRPGPSMPSADIRPVSSDYGDDSLDDIPSPSVLLREAVTGRTELPGTSDKRRDQGDTDSLFDELLNGVQSPAAEAPAQRGIIDAGAEAMDLPEEVAHPGHSHFPSCIPLDSTLDNSQYPEFNAELVLASPTFPDPRGEKRKNHPADEDQENEDKRLKQCTPNTPHDGQRMAFSELAASKGGSPSIQVQPLSEQKDWGDIDPGLLDEFKDIVNFF